MLNKKHSLFSLDLRIEREIVKLNVYQQDTIADIVDRLFDSLPLKFSSKDKLKAKLEEQFRKIIQKKELSQAIKNKLDSLLDQSKIVIMAIETDKNELSMNETPFKILQESVLNGRKPSQEKPKRNFHYLDEDKSNLNIKYEHKANIENQRLYLVDRDCKFDNVILRSKNMSPHKLDNQNLRQADKSQEAERKLDNQDKKWQNLVLQNANRTQNYSQHSGFNVDPRPFSYQAKKIQKDSQDKPDYKAYKNKNNYKSNQIIETHFQRSNSARIMQFLDQPCNNETFHQYKMNRYKSNSNNFIVQQLYNQPSYAPPSNRQYIRPSKSSTRLGYTGQNISNTANTIRNYDNTNICATIRNYDTILNTKSLNAAVSYKNLKGKFNYLGNE